MKSLFLTAAALLLAATCCATPAIGRPDVIVMGIGRRPVILRNTSVNDQISFVDWTPASAFPDGTRHSGFSAAMLDANGDRRRDMFVGGNDGDHLFRQVVTPVVKEQQLAKGELPPIHNDRPLVVLGNGVAGEKDAYTFSGVPIGGSVALILRSRADVRLRVLDSAGVAIATVDRGGDGVEEATQLLSPTAGLFFEVEIVSAKSKTGYALEILSRD